MVFPNASALRARGLGLPLRSSHNSADAFRRTPSRRRAVSTSLPTDFLQMKRPDSSSDSFGEPLLCIILRAVYAQEDDLFWNIST